MDKTRRRSKMLQVFILHQLTSRSAISSEAVMTLRSRVQTSQPAGRHSAQTPPPARKLSDAETYRE